MLLRTAIALLLTTACATTGDDRAPPAELVVQTQRGQELRIATSDLAAVWTSLPLFGVHHAEAFTPAEDTYSVEKLQNDPVTVGFREYGNTGNDRDLVFMRDEQHGLGGLQMMRHRFTARVLKMRYWAIFFTYDMPWGTVRRTTPFSPIPAQSHQRQKPSVFTEGFEWSGR